MSVKYIDAHCHLQFPEYASDREELLAQMRDKEVVGIVVGADEKSSRDAVELAEKNENLFASVGMHPSYAEQEFNEKTFYELAVHQKVVAIGECGLDYYREINDEIKNQQKELFKKHIALAAEVNKPLMIHARPSKKSNDAYQDIIEILKEAKIKYPKLRGDIHFFAGGVAEAEEFFKLNFAISFTAVITFARNYDEVIKTVPLKNMLAETDAPYVAPASRRGERNDPLAVIDVVAKIAEIRNEDPEIVREALLKNTKRLFALPT
jgi:TatD DNase family protein